MWSETFLSLSLFIIFFILSPFMDLRCLMFEMQPKHPHAVKVFVRTYVRYVRPAGHIIESEMEQIYFTCFKKLNVHLSFEPVLGDSLLKKNQSFALHACKTVKISKVCIWKTQELIGFIVFELKSSFKYVF